MLRRRTYVLRIWLEPDADRPRPTLRGTLQPAGGGEPQPFGSLEQLAALLRTELIGRPEPEEDRQ